MASERVTLSDIPTLTDLYASGDLVASSKNDTFVSDQSESDEETSTRKQPIKSINDRVSVRKVDITTLQVDAIVNAANTSLLGGGGVDGAIHRAAGEGLLRECEELDGCETGKAKITKGYELPAKHVIHTVGPIFNYGKVEKAQKLLRSCYSTSLQLAVENRCRSIAFSAISTGVYGYPSNQAAYDACKTVREFLEGEDGEEIDRVIFCTFMPKDVNAYRNELPVWFPPPKEEAEQEAESGKAAEAAESTELTENDEEKTEAAKDAEKSAEPLEKGKKLPELTKNTVFTVAPEVDEKKADKPANGCESTIAPSVDETAVEQPAETAESYAAVADKEEAKVKTKKRESFEEEMKEPEPKRIKLTPPPDAETEPKPTRKSESN